MRIKYLLFISSFVIILNFPYPTFAQSDAIVEEWYTEGQESIIKIYKKQDKYYGDISWIAQPKNEKGEYIKDIYNPDKSKRNRPVTGITLLYRFKFDGKKTWTDGLIYNVENGKEYSGIISLKNPQTLVLRGYIGAPMFGQSVEWQRK